MYPTNSTDFKLTESASDAVDELPSSQRNVALKCFALLFLGCRNFSSLRKEKCVCCAVFPSRPIPSTKAVFPVPLFPITAIKPGLRGIVPENQCSLSDEFAIFSNEIDVTYFVACRRTRSTDGGVSPIKTRSCGSLQIC